MNRFTIAVMAATVALGVVWAHADRDDDRFERVARQTFNNPIAQDGMIRHERAMRDAATAYRQALLAAHHAYYRDLQDALAAARQNRNTPEIAKLTGEMQRIQGDIDRLQEEDDRTSGRTRAFEVHANRDWQPIREVRKGDLLVFKASGSWSFSRGKNARQWGPDGAPNGIGQLVGRVGNQEFVIGSDRRVVAPEDGMLELRANDTDYRDNSGKVDVTLTVRASGRPANDRD